MRVERLLALRFYSRPAGRPARCAVTRADVASNGLTEKIGRGQRGGQRGRVRRSATTSAGPARRPCCIPSRFLRLFRGERGWTWTDGQRRGGRLPGPAEAIAQIFSFSCAVVNVGTGPRPRVLTAMAGGATRSPSLAGGIETTAHSPSDGDELIACNYHTSARCNGFSTL